MLGHALAIDSGWWVVTDTVLGFVRCFVEWVGES